MRPNLKLYSKFSSFTFKFTLALTLVAIVPVVVFFITFEQIADFNQNLQKEAVDSIEGVSEIYRAWVKNESERILLIQQNLELKFVALCQTHHIRTLQELTTNQAFRGDLKAAFDQYTADHSLIFDIRLNVNDTPVVTSTLPIPDRSKYTLHAASLPLSLDQIETPSPIFDDNPPSDTEIPLLIAQPIEQTETPQPLFGDHASDTEIPLLIAQPDDPNAPLDSDTLALPEKNWSADDNKISNRGISLTLLLGIEKEKAELYERLGEKRYLHDSITAIDETEGQNVAQLYQTVFAGLSAFVLFLIIVLVLGISMPMTRRISDLTKNVKAVAAGDLNAKVKVTGNDQFAWLMTQFNDMVDEIRKAQESKAYIERMQAWQEVARRLAHEIKNPLTPIVLSVQQLDRKFNDYIERPQKYRKLLTDVLEIVNEETETLRKLVKNFSEFARMPIPEMKQTAFFGFVAQTVAQNPQFQQQAKVSIEPATSIVENARVHCDCELMRRVLVNIIRNGIEAAQNANISPEILLLCNVVQTNGKDRFKLSIMDNGPGLTDEQKSKLFIPYFTTKTDGTGLGLSIVRKIVEDHSGQIQLHDRDDQKRGTQADIELPLLTKPETD